MISIQKISGIWNWEWNGRSRKMAQSADVVIWNHRIGPSHPTRQVGLEQNSQYLTLIIDAAIARNSTLFPPV